MILQQTELCKLKCIFGYFAFTLIIRIFYVDAGPEFNGLTTENCQERSIGLSEIDKETIMSEMTVPREIEPRKLLQTVVEEEIPAIMSYLSKGKWHVAKIKIISLGAHKIDVHVINGPSPQPLNVQIDQPVGVSLKYRYGKVVFDSSVMALEAGPHGCGGQIAISIPDRVEIIQRRSYFRVNVPESLKVSIAVWHRKAREEFVDKEPEKCWQGKLIDISAGGLQAVLDNSTDPDFHKGQFLTVRFTPLPYEQPIMFNVQLRNTLLTADESGTCLGMQIVGLEASPEGREVLSRICGIVEQYYQINQSGAKKQDLKTAN
ncbi:MAG: PilZ domain-containing protein [Phycisphaerae bacterium]